MSDQNDEATKYEQNKQQTIQNILDHKKRVQELQSYLSQQTKEYQEIQLRKQEEEERRFKARNKKSKFSSFESATKRLPFFNATHIQEKFKDEGFINNEVPALTQLQKDQLIEPTRNKNNEHYNYKIDHPVSKLNSDFPQLQTHQMSKKEVDRLQEWTQVVEDRAKMEIDERHKTLIGSLKKTQVEQMEHLVFKYANSNLRILNPKVSLISENPITPRRVQKLIDLPRLYEKKVWVPNNNYF